MKVGQWAIGVLAGAGLMSGCAKPSRLPAGWWVDLTYEFSEQTVYWPTGEPFTLVNEFQGVTEQGYYCRANRYSASEHGGTHVDAPIHFCATGRTLEQIPVEQLIGPAVVVDVTNKALANRDYQVKVEDLTAWEAVNGRIPQDSIVLLRTGSGRFWPNRARYLGTDQRGPEAVAHLHFPGLHPDAARWLVAHGRIKAVGLDTPSIDHGPSRQFECHQALLAADVLVIENVARLEQLPATGALVFALPMKVKGGTGGPVRLVALLPE